MKNNIENTKAFTLVELIVVIVILAILGTISFISLQGFAAEARDTKRKSDLSNIKTKLELSLIEGVNILSAVEGTGSVILGSSTGTGEIQISGRASYETLSGTYNAGNIDYESLLINKKNFVDPNTEESYKIGVTTYENQYNLAATIENNGIINTYVIGTWSPRESSTARGFKDKIVGNTFYLSGSTIDETGLRIRDVVNISDGIYTIMEIERDYIKVDRNITTPGDNIFLNLDESDYLISRRDSDYKIKVGALDEKYTPYKISN